ncbi:SIMPL domain-containing protein [Mesorhizobium australicum]|uniref:Periplasmic immunogenic protein n=1 Tax=Mesorhizobium australicum TaxID=536018 RepID=A0A1X7PGN4_9HYPH|nr:SIMPL domain-containing protein [Mesorhizobium australicum]SMH50682.1 hypothetical protein SAMN02982922_4225 [Mesorhizobium australicum]
MKKSTLKAALAALALPAFAHSAAFAQEAPRPAPRIVVTGQGEAAIAPDMAVLTLGVMRQADTARAALDAANAAMAEVTAAMKAEGVADRDLQTSNFSISPVYAYPTSDQQGQPPKITGYEVNNTLTVRLREIAKVGTVLDKAVTLGVNQGGGISFTNDDPSAALTEARIKAIKNATAKAKTLAEAAGVGLGKVIEISEQSYMPQAVPYAMKVRDAAAASVPVEAGENAYRVDVNVTFELGQ